MNSLKEYLGSSHWEIRTLFIVIICIKTLVFWGVKRNMVHVYQFHGGDISRDLIIASLHVALQRKTGMIEKKSRLNL